jgi:uncharacterized protein (TIGR03067 family)
VPTPAMDRPITAPPSAPSGAPARTISPAAELKAVEGPWKVVRLEKGDAADAAWPATQLFGLHPTTRARLRFYDGGMWYWNMEDGSDITMPDHIDPSKTPKTVDLREFGPYSADQTPPLVGQGIYETSGHQMKLHLAKYVASISGNERPKDFSLNPHSGDILFVLEHYEPSGDEKTILGRWAVVSATEDGKAVAEDKIRSETLSFGNEMAGSEQFSAVSQDRYAWDSAETFDLSGGAYFLDPADTPKSITLFNHYQPRGANDSFVGLKQEKLVGIYKFDGDRLTIALRRGDKPPQKFESKPDSGIMLLVLEKPKPAAGEAPGNAKKEKKQETR